MSTPFGRRTGVAILAALCAVGAPLLATAPGAAAHQDRWRDVDGNNVTRVRYNGGAFAESAPGQWTEFNADGRPIHSFDETRRDAFTVMLTDRSRNATVVLDLRSREIRGGGAFRPLRTLYAITGAEARGRGWDRGRDDGRRDGPRRDDRGGWDRGGGGARDVEAGPIWNQADAERKCRAKAAELRGEWTGQWHTTVVGRMSVCEIRFR